MTGEPTRRGYGELNCSPNIMREKEIKILRSGVQHATVSDLNEAIDICNGHRIYGFRSDMMFYYYGIARVTLVESSNPEIVSALLAL